MNIIVITQLDEEIVWSHEWSLSMEATVQHTIAKVDIDPIFDL